VLDACQRSLHDLLRVRKHLTEREVRIFGLQLLGGVKYLHKNKSVIHCDLKPKNILLDSDNNVFIGDFGLATKVSPGQGIYTAKGTLQYRAPETLDVPVDGYGATVDIWSLGVIM
jgi:cell cycle serine/threonine-protein kinase CDC5/MSD2